MVIVSVVISGTITTFDEAAYASNLASFLGVDAQNIQLTVTDNSRRSLLAFAAHRRLQAGTITVESTVIMPDEAAATSAAQTIESAQSAGTLSGSLGVTVASVSNKVVSVAFSAPSPPPSSMSALTKDSLSQGQGGSSKDGLAALSDTMLWVIIVSVIVALIFLGCVCAYFCGRRASTLKMHEVDMIAASTKHTPTLPIHSTLGGASLPSEAKAAQDARLIALGMALERQQSLGAGTIPSMMAPPLHRPPSDEEITRAQQQLMAATQAALNVAAQLSSSPTRSLRAGGTSSESSSPNGRVVGNPNARTVASSWLDSAMLRVDK